METISTKTKIILLIIGILCFSITIAFAQGPGFDEDVVDTPFDGGVTLAIAAIAGYGTKKIVDKRIRKQNDKH